MSDIDERFDRTEIAPGVFQCKGKEHIPFDPAANKKAVIGKEPGPYDFAANVKAFAGGKQIDPLTGRPLEGKPAENKPELDI